MELPTRKPNRIPAFDYSAANAYFITICTDKRKNLFWTDMDANVSRAEDVPLTNLGFIVNKAIKDISQYYPSVSVDCYVIMPDHVHLLLQIHTDSDGRSMIAPTISTVIRQMKGAVTKRAGFSPWQKGFYDHVIRGEEDYCETWNYIEGNPSRRNENRQKGFTK